MTEINERLLNELVDAVKGIVRKEQHDRLRDIYLIGDIEKDTARQAIERLGGLAIDDGRCAASRSSQANAESDLSDSGGTIGQTAAANHSRYETYGLLSRRVQGPGVWADR